MNRSIRIPSWAVLAAVVLTTAGLAFATRTMLQPSVVATVDLPAVLDGLEQRADLQAELATMAEGIRQEQQRREAELDEYKKQLDAAADTDQRSKLEEQIALTGLQYQAWIRFTQDKLDVERSLMLQDLYRTIRNAVTDMADVDGIDTVLVDDSKGELGINPESRQSREAQIMQQIGTRRVLFTRDRSDVTDELIQRMNNAWRAAGPREP